MSAWPMSKITALLSANISVRVAVTPGWSIPLIEISMISFFGVICSVSSITEQKYINSYKYPVLFVTFAVTNVIKKRHTKKLILRI